MSNVIRPLRLVADRNVSLYIDMHTKDASAPAQVDQYGSKGYKITVFNQSALSLYSTSWATTRGVTYDQFVIGLILHEVAHIRYGSFARKPINDLWGYLDNVIEDSRIEYHLTREFPTYAKYIQIAIYTIKRDYETNLLTSTAKTSLNMHTSWLYGLVRFGRMTDDIDDDFLSFVVPLLLSSTRGSRANCVVVVDAIYDYLLAACGDDLKNNTSQIEMTEEGMSEAELLSHDSEEKMNAFSDPSSLLTSLSSAEQDELVIKEDDQSFYIATIEQYSKVIHDLRRIFRRFFESTQFIRTYDGDLNMARQMNAYIASITGEPSLDYVQLRPKDESMDLVVLRDVSGSTKEIRYQYAASMVCIAAAVDRLRGVRTALMDFADTHRVVKRFDEPLGPAKLFPFASGGTSLRSALEETRGLAWQSRKRLCIVITDGGIEEFDGMRAMMDTMHATHGIIFGLFNIVQQVSTRDTLDSQVTSCVIEDLHSVISSKILSLL